jgi:hypothetical protein
MDDPFQHVCTNPLPYVQRDVRPTETARLEEWDNERAAGFDWDTQLDSLWQRAGLCLVERRGQQLHDGVEAIAETGAGPGRCHSAPMPQQERRADAIFQFADLL